MIYVKKLIAACAALALAATSMLPMAASASANQGDNITLTLKVVEPKAEYKENDTITLALDVTSVAGKGVNSWHVLVGYDADAFEVVGVEQGQYGSNYYGDKYGKTKNNRFEPYSAAYYGVSSSTVAQKANPFHIHWTYGDATKGVIMKEDAPEGTADTTIYNFNEPYEEVATLTFKVKEGAAGGNHNFSLTLEKDDEGNDKLPFRFEGNTDNVGNAIYVPATLNGTSVKVKESTVALTDFSINPTSTTVGVGRTFKITPTFTPGNATNKTVTYESTDTTVATVAADGTVTGVKEGTATIKATCGGFTKECAVTVENIAITDLALSDVSVVKGSTVTVTPTIAPPDATNKDLTWEIVDPTIATVDANGVVTGVKVGETTLKATTKDGSNITKSCKVTVTPLYVTSLSLNKDKYTFEKLNDTFKVEATTLPEGADYSDVNFTSSNESVATVAADGTVTAKGAGSCDIIAKVKSGAGENDFLTATLKAVVPEVSVAEENSDVEAIEGSSKQITVTENAEGITYELLDSENNPVKDGQGNNIELTTAKNESGETVVTIPASVPVGKYKVKAKNAQNEYVKDPADQQDLIISYEVQSFVYFVDANNNEISSISVLKNTEFSVGTDGIKAVLRDGSTGNIVYTVTKNSEKLSLNGNSAKALDVTGNDPAVITATYEVAGNTNVYKAELNVTITNVVLKARFDKDPYTVRVGETFVPNIIIEADPADNPGVSQADIEKAIASIDAAKWEVTTSDTDYLKKDGNGFIGLRTKNGAAIEGHYADANYTFDIDASVNVKPAYEPDPVYTPNYNAKTDYNGSRQVVGNQVEVRVTDFSSSNSGSPIAATGGEFDSDANNAAAIAAGALGVIALGFVVVARKKRRS